MGKFARDPLRMLGAKGIGRGVERGLSHEPVGLLVTPRFAQLLAELFAEDGAEAIRAEREAGGLAGGGHGSGVP